MALYNRTLRKNLSIPLYYQLRQLLLQEIQAGAYDRNTPLPPEIELAEKFQISRPTVRQAIGSLVNEGILTRIKGKGTFVTPAAAPVQPLIRQMAKSGQPSARTDAFPETAVLSLRRVAVAPPVAAALEITEDSDVFELSRLRFCDRCPSVLITSYIPTEIGDALLERDFTRESLYQVFTSFRRPVRKVARIFEVELPSETDRALLEMPEQTPIFLFSTTAYTDENIPVEFSITKYRGDKNKFFIELNR